MTDPVTDHFTLRDCLWLESEDCMAPMPDEAICQNLQDLCGKLEDVRALLGCPLKVVSMYRPPAYSEKVGGFADDPHTQGRGCDFLPVGMSVSAAKQILLPHLEELAIRMENDPHNDHIHVDTCPVKYRRFFIP